jgi:hypothetical protein
MSPDRVESYQGEEYVVRAVTGSAATKPYRCPGCHQVIRPATPHTVAWPVVGSLFSDSGLDERRHWHTACWRARDARR